MRSYLVYAGKKSVSSGQGRYSNVGTAIWSPQSGEPVHYFLRRFLPDPESMQVLTEVVVQEGQRLDQIAAATLGSSLQWWRVADANCAMAPYALTRRPGVRLTVPVPTA